MEENSLQCCQSGAPCVLYFHHIKSLVATRPLDSKMASDATKKMSFQEDRAAVPPSGSNPWTHNPGPGNGHWNKWTSFSCGLYGVITHKSQLRMLVLLSKSVNFVTYTHVISVSYHLFQVIIFQKLLILLCHTQTLFHVHAF